MCKKFKFDYTNKWYMHNTASVLENDTQTPMGPYKRITKSRPEDQTL